MRFLLTFITATFFITAVFAQKYSNEFLTIGVGARAQALGGAVVASNSDVTAGFWNPAGLVAPNASKNMQLGAMHSEWFAGVGQFDYLALALPSQSENRRIGISLIRFGIDQIPNTLSLYDDDGTINFDNVREFSAADYAVMLSYAQRLKTKNAANHLAIGGSVKIVRRVIGPFASSWGFGVDLGGQYRVGKWRFGALAKDLSTTVNGWSFNFTESEKETLAITGNEIPIESVEITRPSVYLGFAYELQFGKVGVLPELNLIATTDGQRNTLISADPVSIDPSFGLEVNYNQFVFIRAGVSQFQTIQDFQQEEFTTARPSLGLGLKLAAFNIDYAFTNLGAVDNAYSHVISLLFELEKRKR
ncbi:MAG: PorV/PorQ family protein [Saprospiraceae bacterium]